LPAIDAIFQCIEKAKTRVKLLGHCRVYHNVFPKRAEKIVVDGIGSHPFHPEIEDNSLLVHQATDPKRPSLKSFFPKRGEGKGSEQLIGF
jgi:hypothetical protein